MQEWMNHPAMKNIDPIKLELIRRASTQTKGKSGRSMATAMMALITSAKKQGIQFTPNEMSLIIEVLKDGKSKEEQTQIDQMINMVKNIIVQASAKKK